MADKSNDARRAQGNRPADNSTHATASSISAQKNWQGGNEAADFLGLNEGPAELQPAAPMAAQRPQAQGKPVNDPNGWLMEPEQSAPESSEEAIALPPEDEYEEAYESEEPAEEGAEESFDDESVRAPAVLDASWTEPRDKPASSKRPLLLVAGAVVVLGAGAFVFLRQSRHGRSTSDSVTEVAQTQAPLELKQPKPAPSDELEMPKSSKSSARDSGSTRLSVDRAGHTQPVAVPDVVAQNDNEVAPPAIVEKPAPKAQVPAPKPFALAPKAAEPQATQPQVPPAPASTPQLTTTLPKASSAQVVEGPSIEMLKGLVNSMRGKIVRGEYAETQTAFDKIKGHLALAENDPLRRDLVGELRRLDAQAAELAASENAANQAKTAALAGAAASPAKPLVGATLAKSSAAALNDQAASKSTPAEDKAAAIAGAGSGPETAKETTVAAKPSAPSAPNAALPLPEVGSVNASGSAGNERGQVAPGELAAASPGTAPSETPHVRVLNSRTQTVGEGSSQRPSVDDHLTAVPTEAPKLEPVDLTPEVASHAAPATPSVVAPVPAPAATEPVQAPAAASREGSLEASEVLLPPAPINGVRIAQGKDMDTIWTEASVPMDRVSAPVKVMTPLVGNVRVKLKTKEVFEGRLYAVGENSVWIEGPFGRMGLASERIASVDKVEPLPAAGASSKDPKAAPKGDRVKLKTPGGIVFGKLMSTDGAKSMVVTDSGLKLTVDTKELEFVVQPPKIVIKKEAPKG